MSIDEVKSILKKTANLKHKTFLSLTYSCDLRIGEALNLCIEAVDVDRLFMHIKSTKGAKDSCVTVPGQMLVLLKKYLDIYKPTKYVFEGQDGGNWTEVSTTRLKKIKTLFIGFISILGVCRCLLHPYKQVV